VVRAYYRHIPLVEDKALHVIQQLCRSAGVDDDDHVLGDKVAFLNGHAADIAQYDQFVPFNVSYQVFPLAHLRKFKVKHKRNFF
jgi:hypothetical protein